MCVSVLFASAYVNHVHAVPEQAWIGCQIPQGWSSQRLWAAMWVLGPLQEQPGFRAEPSLQPCIQIFLLMYMMIFNHINAFPLSWQIQRFNVENPKDSMKKLLEVRHGIQH